MNRSSFPDAKSFLNTRDVNMQPIDPQLLEQLIQTQKEEGTEVLPLWFVSKDGDVLWSQSRLDVPIISGTRIRPNPDRPEYRILGIEEFESQKICVIRVEETSDAVEDDDLGLQVATSMYMSPSYKKERAARSRTRLNVYDKDPDSLKNTE